MDPETNSATVLTVTWFTCLCGNSGREYVSSVWCNQQIRSPPPKFCGVQKFCTIFTRPSFCVYWGSGHETTHVSDFQLDPSPICTLFLKQKDAKRVKSSLYKGTEDAKKKRRAVRQKRKGLDDKHPQKEGAVYSAGTFVSDEPGPNKKCKSTIFDRGHHHHLNECWGWLTQTRRLKGIWKSFIHFCRSLAQVMP